MSDELEQVRAISRALPFAKGIAQGNTLRRDHLEALFMDSGRDLSRYERDGDHVIALFIDMAMQRDGLTFAQLADGLWGPL